jgi:hypothetical protein
VPMGSLKQVPKQRMQVTRSEARWLAVLHGRGILVTKVGEWRRNGGKKASSQVNKKNF